MTEKLRTLGIASCVTVLLCSTPSLADAVSVEWVPASQTVDVGDPVEIEIWAFSDVELDFNSAQLIITWDPAYLELTGTMDPAYPPPPATPLWSSSFPVGDSFGINEAAPVPADGTGLWVGQMAVGNTWPVTPAGLLLTTLTFDALDETPETLVDIAPSIQLPGLPMGRSKFNVGTQNVLDAIGPATAVTIVPEPGMVLLFAFGMVAATRRTRHD